jgi:hypothetical protein
VLDVIDRFADRDTRDELGLGAIRDGFADLLFPGTSTIQTRAAYFLLVPWIYRRLEERWAGQVGIGARARQDEISLINALIDGDDTDGVIGKEARESLIRLPSDVYWQGTATWGIRTFPGSRELLHRRLERGRIAGLAALLEGESADTASGAWHGNLPPAPDDFPARASLRLRPDDGRYLAERILACRPGSLLALLVREGRISSDVDAPWEHPLLTTLPQDVQELVEQARRFSGAMNGAALLYNLMLAQRSGNVELSDDYASRITEWAAGLALGIWDLSTLWEAVAATPAKVDPPTRTYVTAWIAGLLEGDPVSIARDEKARQLVSNRERAVKGAQARLHNQRALELWGGAAGTEPLTYRWRTAQVFLRDVNTARVGDDA